MDTIRCTPQRDLFPSDQARAYAARCRPVRTVRRRARIARVGDDVCVHRALPAGTVTFVFTDVEGSTRLLQELGPEAYGEALQEHRRLLREAFEENGGVEVDTQGDAFFVAFPTAAGALAASRAAQARLAGRTIRVRIGVHTGTPLVAGEGYVGEDVHRAARIAAAAHGGQVLVSEATAVLADRSELLDLGMHRFKDLRAPERIFQLGRDAFPPIRSLYRTNLPVPATPFLGRQRELADVVEQLGRPETRLLSLTGPGGTGKTRLALQAAAELAGAYPGGVYWVPLAPVRESAIVLSAVAATLQVAEERERSPLDSLASTFAGARVLLVLDNAEHLMPAIAADLAALLAALPTFDLLVTSRERLRVAGEQTYAVPTLTASDATELFLTRARAVDGAFAYTPAVDVLCARLEELPLALELAAARVGLMSVEQLLDRLGQRLDLLAGTRDADPRQQTLRATVAWSYELLDPEERAVFCRFSVFAGGCSLGSAEAVCQADLNSLQSLLDKSLLRRRDTPHGPRIWMLETLREFAAEQLAGEGDAETAVRRHFEHYAALAEQLADEADADREYDFLRARDELDNFRVAFENALTADPEQALRIAGSLGEEWSARGLQQEGRERLAAALRATPDADPHLRIRGLRSAGLLALWQGELEDARSMLQDALALARDARDDRQVGFLLNGLGIEAWYRGTPEEAAQLLSAAIEMHRANGNERGQLTGLVNLGGLANSTGDFQRATELLATAAAQLRARGDTGLAKVLNNLGIAQEASGLREDARASFEESVELSREHNLVDTLGYALASLAHLLLQEDPAAAADRYRESLTVMHNARDLRGIAYCLEGLAAAATRLNDAERGARLLGAAASVRRTTGASLAPLEQAEIDDIAAAAAATLGTERYQSAWNAGTHLAVDQAAEYALVQP